MSSTNFRLRNCSSDGVADHLKTLEAKQNDSLVSVPYDVSISTEWNRFSQPQPCKALWTLSLTVFPGWEGERHIYTMKSEVVGSEPCVLHGRKTETDLMGWLFLPFGVIDVFGLVFDYRYRPLLARSGDIDKKMADSIFHSLSEDRYKKALAYMTDDAKSHLLQGTTLSETDERLLDELPMAGEMLIARAKHPSDVEKSVAALAEISDEDALLDIALTAPTPSIREKAAGRVSGESRLVALARKSQDESLREAAVARLDTEDALVNIATSLDALLGIKRAALSRIKTQASLHKIAKSGNVPLDLRMVAIGQITQNSLLCDIAQTVQVPSVRKEAAARVVEPIWITELALNVKDESIRQDAVERIDDAFVLNQIAIRDSSDEVRYAAVSRVSDQNALVSIAGSDPNQTIRILAVLRITDSVGLATIARTNNVAEVRKAAVERIDDNTVLADIAVHDDDPSVRQTALERITDFMIRKATVEQIGDENVLENIVANDGNADVRLAAVSRITNQTALDKFARTGADSALRAKALSLSSNLETARAVALLDPDPENRGAALSRVNEKTLMEIVEKDNSLEIRKKAVGMIRDSSNLIHLANHARFPEVREEASRLLDAMTPKTFLDYSFGERIAAYDDSAGWNPPERSDSGDCLELYKKLKEPFRQFLFVRLYGGIKSGKVYMIEAASKDFPVSTTDNEKEQEFRATAAAITEMFGITPFGPDNKSSDLSIGNDILPFTSHLCTEEIYVWNCGYVTIRLEWNGKWQMSLLAEHARYRKEAEAEYSGDRKPHNEDGTL